ncbi:MAG: LamG domain-containing protein [Magnetococcus sp. YQC-5]
MNSSYQYQSGATAANILADLVAILTGETNVANLSASCNKATTTIMATIPAGWVLHDATAGTNARCIKSPLADDVSTFKYVVIDTNVAGFILTKIFETWNTTTHTGTNICFNSDVTTACQRVSTILAGEINIFASARFLLLASLYNGQWGSSSNAGPSGCFERTRACPWDTVAAGWPPFVFINFGDITASVHGGFAYAPRLLGKDNTVYTGSAACLYVYAGLFSTPNSVLNGADQKVPDAASGFQVPFLPLILVNHNYMPAPYGEISTPCDVHLIPSGVENQKGMVDKNGETYICLSAYDALHLFTVNCTTGAPPPSGPTLLLMRSETSNGSTAFADASTYARIVTGLGSIAHSTASAHFGNSSILFNGSTQYLNIPYDAVFEITSTTVFSFDTWVNFTGAAKSGEPLFSVTDIDTEGFDHFPGPWGYAFVRDSDGKIKFTNVSQMAVILASSTTVSSGWCHIAFVNDGTSVKIYIDGLAKASASSSVLNALEHGSAQVRIGSNYGNGIYLQGYMEAIRFSNTARWSADFSGSLPNEPYVI